MLCLVRVHRHQWNEQSFELEVEINRVNSAWRMYVGGISNLSKCLSERNVERNIEVILIYFLYTASLMFSP